MERVWDLFQSCSPSARLCAAGLNYIWLWKTCLICRRDIWEKKRNNPLDKHPQVTSRQQRQQCLRLPASSSVLWGSICVEMLILDTIYVQRVKKTNNKDKFGSKEAAHSLELTTKLRRWRDGSSESCAKVIWINKADYCRRCSGIPIWLDHDLSVLWLQPFETPLWSYMFLIIAFSPSLKNGRRKYNVSGSSVCSWSWK